MGKCKKKKKACFPETDKLMEPKLNMTDGPI
jgi:hypothetical protein